MRNLALIGFMGTGKSSVGRLAALTLGFAFVDTDHLIEQGTGRSISDIFEKDGEPAFRKLESETVKSLSERSNLVIATGGGLPTIEGNLESLQSHSLVACLWASPDAIWKRVRRHSHRPLLQGPDPEARIRELLALREPWYKKADVLINTDMRTVPEVAQIILHQFQMARNSRP